MSAAPLHEPPSAISRRLMQSDHWRHAPGAAGALGSHKEWHHFAVFAEEIDLLVNFSLMEGVQAAGDAASGVARVTLLARSEGGWHGGIERCPADAVRLEAGGIDAALGEQRLDYADDAYRIAARLADGTLAVDLVCRPRVTPTLTNDVALARGGSIRWLLVPRIEVDGQVELRGRRVPLVGVLGYHDHNWGEFQWGADFAWDWVIALPRDDAVPWTVVFTRLTDAGRLRSLSDSLLLWHGDTLVRAFRTSEITSRTRGLRPGAGRPFRLPPPMWLAAPGTATDVPRRTEARGEGGGDVLELELETDDLAQIAIPSDRAEDGATLLTEVLCKASVSGVVRGDRVAFDGPALLELVHVAR